jgi:DNA-binding GntR family transcriptional regulator
LVRLEAAGLAATSSGRVYVQRLSLQEIQHITFVRELVECAAVNLACERATELWLRDMEHCILEERALVEAGRVLDLRDQNWEFHRMIWVGSDNPELIRVIETIAARIRLVLDMSPHHPNRIRESHQEHADLVRAFTRRDADRAADVMRMHIRASTANGLRNLGDTRNPLHGLKDLFRSDDADEDPKARPGSGDLSASRS